MRNCTKNYATISISSKIFLNNRKRIRFHPTNFVAMKTFLKKCEEMKTHDTNNYWYKRRLLYPNHSNTCLRGCSFTTFHLMKVTSLVYPIVWNILHRTISVFLIYMFFSPLPFFSSTTPSFKKVIRFTFGVFYKPITTFSKILTETRWKNFRLN